MIKADTTLDAKGLACPIPIVRTKRAVTDLLPGQVLEVQATDKGSTADLKAWTQSVGHHYLGTVEEGEVLKHYVRKATKKEKPPRKFPHIISNEELEEKLNGKENITVIDVREEAEYAFSHIPRTISIPFGELEERLEEINQEADVYVVCRTGNRSNFAAQLLIDHGFTNVKNVVPGMSEWKGNTASI